MTGIAIVVGRYHPDGSCTVQLWFADEQLVGELAAKMGPPDAEQLLPAGTVRQAADIAATAPIFFDPGKWA